MTTQAKVKFHNRFDIEVRDAESNELKQKGVAENIVLNQMYDRLCNFNPYFVNIHFGTGTGTLSPSRTTLFNHLNTKVAVTEEIIKAFPTSKWTRKVTLNPEEFIGSILTEVGIAFGVTNTNLLTHAMIKDAEGNPLNITKGGTDIIIIYASVFITLGNSSDVFFSKAVYSPSGYSDVPAPMKINNLFEQLTGSTPGTINIIADGSDYNGIGLAHYCKIFEKVPTITVDVPNKKRKYSCRIANTEANLLKKVTSFGLGGVLRHTKSISKPITDLVIGSGDGTIVTFNLPISGIQNPVVKINGVVTTQYSLVDGINVIGELPITEFIDDTWLDTTLMEFLSTLRGSYISNDKQTPVYGIFRLRESLNGKTLNLKMLGGNGSILSNLTIESSVDGINWTTRLSKTGTFGAGLLTDSKVVTWDDLYYRVRNTGIKGYNESNVWVSNLPIPQITFDTPPAIGIPITLSGNAPYYPKDENYVTDVTFELIFEEGV